MTESEMWCSADSMIKTHGPRAAMQAAIMADRMLKRGNGEGQKTWTRITRAIRELEGHESNAR